LKELGLSQLRAGRLLGASGRSARRWAGGDAAVPESACGPLRAASQEAPTAYPGKPECQRYMRQSRLRPLFRRPQPMTGGAVASLIEKVLNDYLKAKGYLRK